MQKKRGWRERKEEIMFLWWKGLRRRDGGESYSDVIAK